MGFIAIKPIFLSRHFLQQGFALAFNNVIREHDRFNQSSSSARSKTVSECAVMPICPILPASRAAKKCLQCAACTDYGVKLFHAWVVCLIQVDIVGAEVAEACFNVCLHCFAGACRSFVARTNLSRRPSIAPPMYSSLTVCSRVPCRYSLFRIQ